MAALRPVSSSFPSLDESTGSSEWSDWTSGHNDDVSVGVEREHLLCVEDLSILSGAFLPPDGQLVLGISIREKRCHESRNCSQSLLTTQQSKHITHHNRGDGCGICLREEEIVARCQRNPTSRQHKKYFTPHKSQVMILILFAAVVAGVACSTSIRVVFPGECNITEFYDESQLRCDACNRNPEVRSPRLGNDTTSPASVRSSSPFDCTCAPGFFKFPATTDEESAGCIQCPAGTVTSTDGFRCAQCSPPDAYDPSSQTCQCPAGFIRESVEAGQLVQACLPCPGFTRRSESARLCQPCHRSFIRNASSLSCVCPPDGFKLEADICIPNAELSADANDAHFVKFEHKTIRSLFFVKHLQASSYNCKRLGDRTACQMLANLCVLIHFTFTDDPLFEKMTACLEYRKLMMNSGSSFNYQLWPKKAPWLYYGEDTKSELTRNNVPSRFTVGSALMMMAFRYSGQGHLVAASRLNPSELQLCRSTRKSAHTQLLFGRNVWQECQVSSQEIWESSPDSAADVMFYDLYLLSTDGKMMYPIPVLNLQLEKNGGRVNMESRDEWQLVRRFFLVEGVTGIEEKGSLEKNSKRKTVVRFIQSFELDINLREMDGSGSIYPPLITISYGEVSEEDVRSNRQVRLSFKTRFWMDQRNVERDVSISLSVLCPIGILWSLFQTWTWGKRCGKHGVDLVIILQFLLISAGTIAHVFFLVGVACCIHWFVFFKKQSVLHTMLPTPAQEYWISIYILIASVLKSVKLAHDLITACSVHIFLIDWERPKSRYAEWPHLAKLRPLSMRSGIGSEDKDDKEENGSQSSGQRRGSIPNSSKKSDDRHSPCPDVSIWRSIFVANEWLELFTHRRLSIELHLFLVIFVLKILRFENMVKHDMLLSLDIDEGREFVPDSLTCRIAVGSIVYVGLALIQIAYKSLFHERFFSNKMKEFVDLCSVSNVSVFIWVHRRFGYYIHGRSANGRADVNMKEMNELLKREEDDLCSKRGLVPNTDQQTFEMTLPIAMFDQYSRLRSFSGSYQQSHLKNVPGIAGQSDRQKIAPTYVMVSKFLAGFIEHASREFEYTVKDKTILEAILDAEFDETRDKGYLYR